MTIIALFVIAGAVLGAIVGAIQFGFGSISALVNANKFEKQHIIDAAKEKSTRKNIKDFSFLFTYFSQGAAEYNSRWADQYIMDISDAGRDAIVELKNFADNLVTNQKNASARYGVLHKGFSGVNYCFGDWESLFDPDIDIDDQLLRNGWAFTATASVDPDSFESNDPEGFPIETMGLGEQTWPCEMLFVVSNDNDPDETGDWIRVIRAKVNIERRKYGLNYESTSSAAKEDKESNYVLVGCIVDIIKDQKFSQKDEAVEKSKSEITDLFSSKIVKSTV